MAIILRDLTFPIKVAELGAAISDPYWCDTYNDGKGKDLLWGINIEADECETHELYPPSVYHESIRFPVGRWMDIAGQSLSWDVPYDDVTGEPNGAFYVAEHESINRADLHILDRAGTDFRVEWDGLCNVFWDDEYGEDVPFSIRAVARFTGVIVRGNEDDTLGTLRNRLGLFLEPDDFVQGGLHNDGHKYGSGVGSIDCTFTPLLR